MKQILITVLIALTSLGVSAQSLEDGIKLYNYEKYETAKKVLTPLAENSAKANYYLGLSELALGNVKAAGILFAKYPTDYANISGTVRVKFITAGAEEGMKAARDLANMGKKREYLQKKFAADAITYSKGGDKQQAVEWYKIVMEKMITTEILISTGDAYQGIRTGGGEAMNHYEKASAKEPNNSLAFSRIGKLWYNAKNYQLALENWENAKKADPENPLPYRDLADAYTRVQKFEPAKENLEKYMQYCDKTDRDWIRYAEILFLAKDYDKSIETINKLMNKGVVQPNFYGILGYSYLEMKDSASHVKALENINIYFKKQDPKKIFSLDYLKLGRAQMKNGKMDEANATFNKALSLDTTDNKIDTYRDIAESFRKEKEWLNAASWYDKIHKDFAETATPTDYFWGGYSYFVGSTSLKDDSIKYTEVLIQADGVYEKMTSKFPDQPSGFYWRGRVNAARDPKGETGIAAPYFLEWLGLDIDGAKKSDKDKLIAYQYLALYYYNSGEYEKCIEFCDIILEMKPGNGLGEQLKEFSENELKKK